MEGEHGVVHVELHADVPLLRAIHFRSVASALTAIDMETKECRKARCYAQHGILK